MSRFSAQIVKPQQHHIGDSADMVLSLTPREVDILRLLCVGYSDKAIARELNITPSTVSSHLHSVYQKFGVRQGRENVRGLLQCKAVAEGVVKLQVSQGDRRHGRDGDRRKKAAL
jgi:DNA-binding NarL/FixJ family response regulator